MGWCELSRREQRWRLSLAALENILLQTPCSSPATASRCPTEFQLHLFAKRTIPRFLTLILAVLAYIYNFQVSQTYVSGCRSVAENASLAELYQLRTVFSECNCKSSFPSHQFKSICDVIDSLLIESLLIDIRASATQSAIEFLDELAKYERLDTEMLSELAPSATTGKLAKNSLKFFLDSKYPRSYHTATVKQVS